jgi:hypothetical protein
LGIYTLAFAALSGYALGPEPFPGRTSPPRPSYVVPGQELPDGYERYRFGMTRSEIIRLVAEDKELYAYDADFIEGFEQEDWSVLIAVGPPLVDTVWFVFDKNEELYNIIVRFNAKKFSYLEILRALQQKYGRSNTLGHDRTVWQNTRFRIQLEKDLHVKYLDLARFAEVSREFNPELYQIPSDKYGIFNRL